MDTKEEMQKMLNMIWVKLQGLPNADPVELGAFLILLTFILVALLMFLLTCVCGCCCCPPPLRTDRRHQSLMQDNHSLMWVPNRLCAKFCSRPNPLVAARTHLHAFKPSSNAFKTAA
uniref:Small integral membrane protein 5 n=1 Tax=Gouania willdenowi TaxID=441366 RepID=A0A8C5ESZ0_GOUWI